MRSYRLTIPARNDLIGIRKYGEDQFGIQTADEYGRLISQALKDVRIDPFRAGSKKRPELGKSFLSYHISFSRNRSGSKIKRPKHFLIYYETSDNFIVISRILQDSMDLKRHIPIEHLENR